jgi:predicted nucleic acid-binding protein
VTALVVDASVAVKWFVVEEHSLAAQRCFAPDNHLCAPDLIRAEVANVFWKKTRRGEITSDLARAMLNDFNRLPLDVVSTGRLTGRAFDLADRFGRSVYDCLYLALADDLDCRLCTADLRLYDAPSGDTLHGRMLWIGDLA